MHAQNRFLALLASLIVGLAVLAGPASAASIAVTVNEEPITDVEIQQRAQLLRLEGRGASNSDRLQIARQELIDDQLKLQEAQRLGISVSENEVDNAVQSLARNMRISTNNLDRVLTQNGVNPSILRERLRAQLTWNKIGQQAIAPRVQFSNRELEEQAEAKLEDTDNIDYILKEVIFLIPEGSGRSQSQRTAEANQYRRSFQGCDSAVELSMSYTDAAVIDVGRRHATQLPDPISDELARLDVGGISSPRVAQNGISMLAVCQKTQARDLTFVTNEVRQEVGSDKLNEEADAYLERLRNQANIVNR